jgi:predicted N-acetyltransferase YhbS
MQVRPATTGDAAGIARLNANAWRTAFGHIVSARFLNTYDGGLASRQRELADPGHHDMQLVADDGSHVVGWIFGTPCDDDDCDTKTYEVRGCYVEPNQWRMGIGRQLMMTLLHTIDGMHWKRVCVWTPLETPASHAFYESIGFERDGREDIMQRDGPVKIIRFQLALTN